jgi:hypothetical protein
MRIKLLAAIAAFALLDVAVLTGLFLLLIGPLA